MPVVLARFLNDIGADALTNIIQVLNPARLVSIENSLENGVLGEAVQILTRIGSPVATLLNQLNQ